MRTWEATAVGAFGGQLFATESEQVGFDRRDPARVRWAVKSRDVVESIVYNRGYPQATFRPPRGGAGSLPLVQVQ